MEYRDMESRRRARRWIAGDEDCSLFASCSTLRRSPRSDLARPTSILFCCPILAKKSGFLVLHLTRWNASTENLRVGGQLWVVQSIKPLRLPTCGLIGKPTFRFLDTEGISVRDNKGCGKLSGKQRFRSHGRTEQDKDPQHNSPTSSPNHVIPTRTQSRKAS
jgi:hypothetical protein